MRAEPGAPKGPSRQGLESRRGASREAGPRGLRCRQNEYTELVPTAPTGHTQDNWSIKRRQATKHSECRTIHEPHYMQITKTEGSRSHGRQPFPPLLWRLVTPSSALGTAGLSGDKLQVPHAPQVQSPSVGPLPTSRGSTPTHAWPVLPAASDTMPVTMKSLWFVLIFDRALAHSLETCRGDGHHPGSK